MKNDNNQQSINTRQRTVRFRVPALLLSILLVLLTAGTAVTPAYAAAKHYSTAVSEPSAVKSITTHSVALNDYLYSQPLGTENSGAGTFLGAYDRIARLLKAKTHARVILVMPQETYQGIYRGFGTVWRNHSGYTLVEERRAIQEIADKYHFETFTPTVLTQSNIQKDTLDNLHPNGSTQIRIGKQFMRYLEQTA